MRQIKFRGKRVDNNEWVYGDLVNIKTADGDTLAIKDTPYNVNNGFINIIPVEVIPETVGQFTGLKDKNGKPIYEGDILKSWYSRDTTGKDIVTFNYPVEFEATHDSAGFNIEFLYNAEVIGNIHDNPELLSHDKN